MALKITILDLERLKAAIQAEHVQIYARARLKHYTDLHNSPGNALYQRPYLERWRWDVFHKAEQADPGLCNTLYTYLNDDNIAAALRRILPAG